MDNPELAPSEPSQQGAVTLTPAAREPPHTRAQSPVSNPEQPYTNVTTPDHVPPTPAAPPSSVSYSPFAIPHPKRFNAVNITKKFLQKNSSPASASAIASSLAVAAKTGSPAPRPAPQPSTSHSKLVTTKLTSTAPLIATTSSGWSRPSSATPPVSTTPSSSSNTQPPQPPVATPAVPQFPHVGKVIQPQPRNALVTSSPLVKKDASVKPAWGNAKSLPMTSDTTARNDFPTAAEVAQGRIVKVEEQKPEDALAPRHVPPQEADAFRGVHLDPNAHHWDEMEEDDDNFLDNVIEFGDGRQYKVVPTITGQPLATGTTPVARETPSSPTDDMSTEPVSKEERFADDFDRSWPRTRQSPIALQRDLPSRSSQHMSNSPAPSQPGYPSVEGSRVLFNERSNRLEPYTSPHLPNRLGSSFGFSRRNAHGEHALSPVESRYSKDAPPHSPVHLLQKPSEAAHDSLMQSSRSYGGDFVGRRNAERDGGPRASGVDYGQSKVRSRDPGRPSGSFHGSSEKRHRRLSGASFASSVPDGQQGSSHSSDVPFSRRSQARESPLQHLSVLPANASAPVPRVPELPGPSHVAPSEVTPSGIVPVPDIEDVHKTTMHISAERARQRRQLEEEEREKEKERARKKAAELEVRMIQAQKTAATEIIEQAVASAQAQGSNQLVSDSEEHKSSEAIQCDASERPPSPRPIPRPQCDSKTSRSTTTINGPLPPSEQVDSWRSKTRLPPQQLPALSPQVFQESSGVGADDNLEVVDFSDLGKFVGSEPVSLASETLALPSYPPVSSDRRPLTARPVASDFFEDASPHIVAKIITSSSPECHPLPIVPEATVLQTSEQTQAPSSSVPMAPTQGMREHESHRFSGVNGSYPFVRGYPSPTTSHHRLGKGAAPFRQVTMSALDDVMSRIKGALDDMQVDAGRGASLNEPMDWRANVSKTKVRVLEPPNASRTLSKDARWLPPALRQPQQDLEQEVFAATCCELPCSPRPATLVVKLPTVLRPVDAVPKRQLHLLKISSSHVRFDTLSWDPPVDGMSKRDLSVNEILFKRPPPGKGSKPRYRVQLPRPARIRSVSLPKVNLPSGFAKTNTAPGRSKAVDDLPTWRRGLAPSTTEKIAHIGAASPALNVTSCSPAPDLPALPSELTVSQVVSAKSESSLRQRTQPKLPAGSAVGFYRDPGPSFQVSKSTVNFTVISELEEVSQVSQQGSSMLFSPSIDETSTATILSGSKGSDAIASSIVDEVNHNMHLPTLSLITQADSKASEEPMDRSLRTPASTSFSAAWTKSPLSFSSKDSPARAPDPEHLKAVWSQTTDKEQVSAVNSLEGIADDLTALPFTIHDVKSEDGETPPPTSAAVVSKISIHDVTRAFQQVPTSSNVPSHRPPPLSPPAVNGPVTRPPTFNYPSPLPAPGPAIRSHFAAFSSPMLAHSPSPTVMYPPTAPSPIPRIPVNGHPQLYNQPMWVPMQASQGNSTIRPVPSPYPTQMVAYPAPTPVHPVYTPGLSPPNVPPSVSSSAPPRPRGMAMLSPIMHPAAPANVPIYNGSPVLMHPSAMVVPGHRPLYINSGPPERGQGRSEGISAPLHMQQPSHSQSHIPPQPMYSHVPFSRPSW